MLAVPLSASAFRVVTPLSRNKIDDHGEIEVDSRGKLADHKFRKRVEAAHSDALDTCFHYPVSLQPVVQYFFAFIQLWKFDKNSKNGNFELEKVLESRDKPRFA